MVWYSFFINISTQFHVGTKEINQGCCNGCEVGGRATCAKDVPLFLFLILSFWVLFCFV